MLDPGVHSKLRCHEDILKTQSNLNLNRRLELCKGSIMEGLYLVYNFVKLSLSIYLSLIGLNG